MFLIVIYLINFFIFCTGTGVGDRLIENVTEVAIEDSTEVVIENGTYYCGDTTQISGYWKTNDPYELKNISCVVKFEEFYKIKLTIELFELNPITLYYTDRKNKYEFNDFVKITPSETVGSNGKGIILLGSLNKTVYIIPTNEVTLDFIPYEHPENNTYKGYKIKWERYGELPTTTVSTTTTEMVPTPGRNESGIFVGYIYGPRPNETLKDLLAFKKLLAMTAKDYCKDMNMDLEEDITETNVKIIKIVRCNIMWPDSDKCSEMYFEIPVVLKNTAEYQLNSRNLKNIWNRISNSELPTNWSKYEVPDNGRSFGYWLIASCVIVAIFFLFLFLIRYVQLTFIYEDGKDQILSNFDATPRQSDINWPNQVTPPLFDNTEDYPYRNVKSSYANPTFIDDEFSEEEIMNVHNFKQHNDSNFTSFDEYFKNKNK